MKIEDLKLSIKEIKNEPVISLRQLANVIGKELSKDEVSRLIHLLRGHGKVGCVKKNKIIEE